MESTVDGRFTARMDEGFVVFVMGVRVNRLWDLRGWPPTLLSLRTMLRELRRGSAEGFLGGRTYLRWREVLLVQYWSSLEALERFARSPEESHMPGWKRFNRRVRKRKCVGLWHEAYIVGPGCYEAVYADTPVLGLAGATEHVRAFGGQETARRRRLRAGLGAEVADPGLAPRVAEAGTDGNTASTGAGTIA